MQGKLQKSVDFNLRSKIAESPYAIEVYTLVNRIDVTTPIAGEMGAGNYFPKMGRSEWTFMLLNHKNPASPSGVYRKAMREIGG